MTRILRFMLAGSIGGITGWIIIEPWKNEFGYIRDFLMLYSVSYGIAFGIIVEKFFFARASVKEKVSWVKKILKKWYLYMIPFAGVLLIKLIFSYPTNVLIKEDTHIETRLLLLDVSGSMQGRALKELKSAVNKYFTILEKAKSDDLIGCITFSDDAQLLFAPSTSYASIKNDIQRLEAGGGTNMLSALQMATDLLDRHERAIPREIIIVSDGEPKNRRGVLNYISKIKEIPVYTIGVGSDYNRNLLMNITEQTGGKFFASDDIAGLTNVFVRIAQQGLTETGPSRQDLNHKSALPFWKRVFGWGICGLLIGLTIGIGNERVEMIMIGCIGGALGGILSSICFVIVDLLNITNGSLTRFISFALLGICMGLTIYVVEMIYSRLKPADTSFNMDKLKVY